jgi:hypothetical protein
MSFETIGEIIATRTLYLVDDDNSKRIISVFVGKPQPSEDQSGYRCPFQLVGIGNQKTQFAQGHDSIHALQSAMILIAANLNHLNDELGGRLRWEGSRNDDLGFP